MGVPSAALLLSKAKRLEPYLLSVLIFLTCKTEDINFISMEWYRGTAKGFEISMADLVVLIFLGLMILQKQKYTFNYWPPGSTLYALYFSFSFMSIVNADVDLYTLFELLKMFRMYLYFWVLYQYIQTPEQIKWVLKTLSIVFIYVFLTMLKQKYLEGMWQAKGPFPHQNSLVLYINMFNCVLFSYALNVQKKNILTAGYWMLAFCIGTLCTIFTFSRGGLLFMALGLGLIFFLSFSPKQINTQKILIAVLAVIASVGIAYKASDSISERFETAPEESMEVRAVLAVAAVNMANDKMLGVGLNNFGLKINPPYWYGDHIPRKESTNSDDEEEKGGLVETIYLMIAAECGWHTLVIYLFFIWGFLFRAFRLFFFSKSVFIKAVSLGIGAGLLSIYLNSCFEWVLKQTNNFYQLMFIFVLVLALEKINRKENEKRKRPQIRKSQKPNFSESLSVFSDISLSVG